MLCSPRAAIVAALALGLIGCSGGSRTPATPGHSGSAPLDLLDNPIFNDHASLAGSVSGMSALGGATLAINPDTGTGEVLPLRGVTATDDSYMLSLQNFFSARNIRITGISATADDLIVDYVISHPFPAPADLSAPPNGSTNRADLGITGRAVFLVDVPTATGNTFFGDVVANARLLRNVDGYVQPKGTIPQAATKTANAFPYKLIVDETLGANGNRVGISNLGLAKGNYRSQDGWQASNIGATRDQWTGFDYLHQGQSAASSITIRKSELSGSLNFDLVILAKYNDPRGGTNATQKRANRLPSTPASVANFVYRMPYGALDVGKVTYRGETGGLQPNVPLSSTEVRFTVRDWDARANVTTRPDVSDDSDPTTVEPGGPGMPTVTVDIPSVTTSAVTLNLNDDDTAIGGDVAPDSGEAGDALYFTASVLNTAGTGGQSAGEVRGMLRTTDISNSQDRSAYEFVLDPDLNLITNAAQKPALETFQAFSVNVGGISNDPPTAVVELAAGTNPVIPALGNVVFNLVTESDPESDTVLYDIDTFYNGSFIPDATGVDPADPPSVLFTGQAPNNPGASNLVGEARVRYYDPARAASPIEIILPYEVAPASANTPPTATITLQGGPNPTIPSGGTIQYNLDAENDVDGDPVFYEIMYNYTGVFTADVAAFDPAGAPPIVLHTSTAQTNPGPGPSARTTRIRYYDPLRAATPIVVDLNYTLADPGCGLVTNTYLFAGSAEGFVGGEVYGLPNGDEDTYGNFSQVTCTNAAVEAASGGLMNGNYWGSSWDVESIWGTCAFVTDYGANGDYNLVSPLLVVPTLCGATEVSVVWDLHMLGNAGASFQIYTSTDEGCSWVAQGSPINVTTTDVPVTVPNATVTFTGISAGQEILVRFQYRDPSAFGYFNGAAGYAGAWIDNVRIRATSAGTWTGGTPNPPPTTYFSDNFEGANNWSTFGLPQTDAAIGCVLDPGPWGGWNICPASAGFVTGNAMTVGGDLGSCTTFPGDLAHSSDFNIVSPLLDLTAIPATAVIRFDEIMGLTSGTLNTQVYMAINPASGDIPAWGAPIATFTHTLGEPSGSQERAIAIPGAYLGQNNVRVRIRVTTDFNATPDTCNDFGAALTVVSVGDMGFDNFSISEPRCP
ncbi:MAG: hypothetical protein GEEBNDBF_00441 [bacterium]|nr:hypothetical protein [bacterium]